MKYLRTTIDGFTIMLAAATAVAGLVALGATLAQAIIIMGGMR